MKRLPLPFVLLSLSCTDVPVAEVGMLPPSVTATGHVAQALEVASLRSFNGTYGAGCLERVGAWSALVDSNADTDFELLTVIQGNDACTLTLTGIRAGADDGELYTADPAIELGSAFAASNSAFRLNGAGAVQFSGNARLSAAGFDGPFQLVVLLSDDASQSSASHQAIGAYNELVASDGATSYWRLGETGTTTASDGIGSSSGTYFNGVTLGVAGAISGNTAARFDGSNDYVLVPRTIQNDFTIEFWFRSTQGSGSGSQWYQAAGMVDAEVGGVTNDFGISLFSDGRVAAGTGQPDVTLRSSSGFNNGVWHHVVFTRTRTNGALRLYIDGSLSASGTGGTNSLNAPANIRIGSLQTAIQYFAGDIDEVAVYPTVLTAAQVLMHYRASGR